MSLVCDKVDGWTKFVDFVKARSSPSAFENWISPIVCLSCSDLECVLQVPNIFVQEYLISNFFQDLRCFLPVKADGNPSVKFVIQESCSVQRQVFVENVSTKSNTENRYNLNPSYTFDSFIEGSCNQFVRSAAMGVANRPSRSYNPLFMHGHVGLGKTHLLHAIGHHVKISHKKLKMQCLTAEEFVNALVDSLRNKTVDKLKRFYRSLDILLIDDIQFLQDKVNFETEFCNMFESLINQSKQIVITSDKSPGELRLSERMVARMEWGLVAQLGMPDLETRVAILQHKAEIQGIFLDQKTAFNLARELECNVRQIEGVVNMLCAQSKMLGKQIDDDLIANTLHNVSSKKSEKKNGISVDDVIEEVAAFFSVKISDIKGTKRTKAIATARQVAMFLSRELVRSSLIALGAAFHKTHSTILHACRVLMKKLQKDNALFKKISEIRQGLLK